MGYGRCWGFATSCIILDFTEKFKLFGKMLNGKIFFWHSCKIFCCFGIVLYILPQSHDHCIHSCLLTNLYTCYRNPDDTKKPSFWTVAVNKGLDEAYHKSNLVYIGCSGRANQPIPVRN